MVDQAKPRRLILQRTGPAFASRVVEPEPMENKQDLLNRLYSKAHVTLERRILREINDLLAEHIPHQSAAVRCALRQALGQR